MAWYAKLEAMKDGLKGKDETGDTFMFAEAVVDTDVTPAGTRLFVGNLSMNSSEQKPETGDEVLVGFEHGQEAHPDFLWAPDLVLI
jgi:hypothetical protein